jgi:hypothetical protein
MFIISPSKFIFYVTDFKKIVSQLQTFLRDTSKNPEKYRQKPSDFTRNRKLPFSFICKFFIQLLKKVYKQNSMIFLKMDLLAPNLLSVKHEKN